MKEYYFRNKKLGTNTILVKIYQKEFPYPIKSLGVIAEKDILKEFEIFQRNEKLKDIDQIYFERMLISFEVYKQCVDGSINENNIEKFIQPLSDAFMLVVKFYSYLNFDCNKYIDTYLNQDTWKNWTDKNDFIKFCQRYKNGMIND